ncbi:hypothetical protein F5882DRAFT_411936, partial [Hyaloscypha sp. PMI_1271]
MVTSITQILHRLHSLALLLSLSLTLKRLRSHGTLAIALGLKSTNHSLRSPGIHVTFSQTLSHSLLPDSQADSSQELSQDYTCAPETSRDKWLQIQI